MQPADIVSQGDMMRYQVTDVPAASLMTYLLYGATGDSKTLWHPFSEDVNALSER